jgi:hypothetical protein
MSSTPHPERVAAAAAGPDTGATSPGVCTDDTDDTGDTGDTAGVPVSVPGASSSAALVFDDPLSRPSADDIDRGWGEPASGSADDDFIRFLNEKPPHHL